MAILNPDRYNKKNYLEIEQDLSYDYLGNEFINILRTDATNITTHTIQFEEAYRIDLLSKNIYGTSSLFWIIRDFNSILYMEELTLDRELQIPSITDIEAAIRKYRRL